MLFYPRETLETTNFIHALSKTFTFKIMLGGTELCTRQFNCSSWLSTILIICSLSCILQYFTGLIRPLFVLSICLQSSNVSGGRPWSKMLPDMWRPAQSLKMRVPKKETAELMLQGFQIICTPSRHCFISRSIV